MKHFNLPKPTCRLIDQMLKWIEAVDFNGSPEETWLREGLEELRSSNGSLRTAAEGYHDQCEALEDQIYTLEIQLLERV